MKKILLNNLSLKLLAILIAGVTWFAVMYNLNPIDTKTLVVPVKIVNGEVINAQNWVYDVVGELEVEVTVEAHSFDLPRITESNFNLYVDMLYPTGGNPTGGASTQRRYQINREVVGNTDIIQRYTLKTEYMDFVLEEIVTREFAVDVITSGDVAENFTASEKPTSVPESVQVTGRSSEVDRIKRVVYYLDIKDASEEINETGVPSLLDNDGNELTDLESVTISPETIQVCQPINQTKSVVVTCNAVSGEPATGYGLAGVTLDVTSVRVAGYRAVLADIFAINIPAELIDIEGLTANKTFAIDLAELELPEGVTLMGSSNIVNVTVQIEKNKQNNFRLQLPDDVVLEGEDEMYDYSFVDTVVFITVEGISNDLDNMESTNIVATVDVSGYEAGVHSIPLSVRLPEGISLVGVPEVEVEITVHETEPETTLPLPTPTPVPVQPTPSPAPTETPTEPTQPTETPVAATEEPDTTQEEHTTQEPASEEATPGHGADTQESVEDTSEEAEQANAE